jgi:poly(A) polymerase
MTSETLPAAAQSALAALLADHGVDELFMALEGGADETRIVGGAVRNALMGASVSEIDFATTALPEEVMRRAALSGFKPVPTGIEHGTVTVVVHGRPFEVTTLREDIETDGRRAIVRFGRSFAADALRRDFTMNALSLGRDGKVHDEVGGLADIAARRVRFIGEARQRIAEDYLRILRFFRFHASYATGKLDREGFAAAIELREGLRGLSAERVRSELLKLLMAPGAVATADQMLEGGFWPILLHGVPHIGRFDRFVADRNRATSALERLASLAVMTTEDAMRLRDKLRLSNAEETVLAKIARAGEALHGWSRNAADAPFMARVTRLVLDIGTQPVMTALSIETMRGEEEPLAQLLDRVVRIPAFPLSGSHILARGVSAGPAVGKILALAREAWIAASCPLEEPQLAEIIEQALRDARAGRSGPGFV